MSNNRQALDADGYIIVDLNEGNEIKDMVKEFMSSETGRKYRSGFYVKERSDDDLGAAIALAQKRAKRDEISVKELIQAFVTLMDANVIPRRSEDETNWQKLTAPPEPPDTRPRDRNNKILSESQLKWRSFRIYCEGDKDQGILPASMEEIKRRKREDPEFAVFYRKNWEQQLAESTKVNVPDAVVPANQRVKDGRKVSPELLSFAAAYTKTSVSQLSPKGGFVTLFDGKQMSWTDFTAKQKLAAEAGLI
jgi:hypothetical protein